MKRQRKPQLETICTRTDVTGDHVALYEFTYVDKKTGEVDHQWHPLVNLDNGDIYCDCPDFYYRRRCCARDEGKQPNIGTPKYQCKHIQPAIRDCIETGDIEMKLRECKL